METFPRMTMLWCRRELVDSPFHFGLCLSEKAFKRETKKLGVKNDVSFIRNQWSDATAHFFEKDGDACIIVCIRKNKEIETLQIYSLLIHEAVHIWQEVKARIGEPNPSNEFEAYSIQAIAQRLMYAYEDLTTKKKGKKK